MQHEAWVGGQPSLDRRRLVRGGVVEHEVDVELVGDLAVDRCRNFLNSIARWRWCSAPITLPVVRSSAAYRLEVPGALVVVRRALGHAGQHRQDRRGAIERLDLGLLVHAQHDRALRRGEIQADDVADLVDEQRVLGQLPASPTRCGCRPNARQIRETAVCESPTSPAIDRVDQCVASFGVGLQRATITSSTCASLIVRGRPGRGSSTSPSKRSPDKPRRATCRTVAASTPRRAATRVL